MPANDRVSGVELILGYQFNNPEQLLEALRLPGSAFGRRDGNKELAQVGDSVLRLVLVLKGYDEHATRGQISKILQDVGENTNLEARGFAHKIERFIEKNPSQPVVSTGPMATTVEALLGAVFLDSGKDVEVAQQVMEVLGLSWPSTAD